MNLEFLIVGIARGEEKDYSEFYKQTQSGVYNFVLSIVKNKYLAREVTVETYRRVEQQAYRFDTDLSGEFWLYDIARHLSINSLQDPYVKENVGDQPPDNLSFLLQDTVMSLKGERGSIILLKSLSNLKNSEIARLLWFYNVSIKNEYRRGIRELLAADKERNKNEIPSLLRSDAKEITPDLWEYIISDKGTLVASVSHEEMSLSEETLVYTSEDKKIQRLKDEKRKSENRGKALKVSIISVAALCLIAIVIAVSVIISQKNGSEEDKDDNVQHGNSVAMLEIDGKFFYQGSDNGLYVWDCASGASPVKLSDDYIKELITDGEKLFYRNYDDGKIYFLQFDGSGRTLASPVAGTQLEYYDGYIYYSFGTGIYKFPATGITDSAQLEEVVSTYGDENLFRYDIEIDSDGTVYFSSGVGGGFHRVVEYQGEKLTDSLYHDEVYSIQIEEGFLYFDVLIYDVMHICRMDLADDSVAVLDEESIIPDTGAYYIYEGSIYYSGVVNGKHGLCKAGADGKNPELLIPYEENSDKYITDIYVTSSNIYCYYSDGKADSPRALIAYDIQSLESKVLYGE